MHLRVNLGCVLGTVAIALLMVSNAANALSIKDNHITLRIGSEHPLFLTYMKKISKLSLLRLKNASGQRG